jgi:hypothetical protein
MNFTDQDRECCVTLSGAKGLVRWAKRCFAALSMTVPTLVVNLHHRAPSSKDEDALSLYGIIPP